MSGLVGIAGLGDARDDASVVAAIQALATHPLYGVAEPVWSDSGVAAARIHSGRLPGPGQPAEVDGLTVWLDGEIVDSYAVAPDLPPGERSAARALLAVYEGDGRADLPHPPSWRGGCLGVPRPR